MGFYVYIGMVKIIDFLFVVVCFKVVFGRWFYNIYNVILCFIVKNYERIVVWFICWYFKIIKLFVVYVVEKVIIWVNR